ncbi:hypothetical protein GCM10010387_36570 [Streptomyces inusitatus]|uniref:Uncharacterized protein n=1 Tax=Streptomyces inusitatus TaxID=68221 RepID=A0A918QAC2_9ACTN|nr:hypothetical protein [Streptomyces inusitatus]GGZ39158.1 hypothetical protein GCM10010387_36570 [Streptomyces inusitatus]
MAAHRSRSAPPAAGSSQARSAISALIAAPTPSGSRPSRRTFIGVPLSGMAWYIHGAHPLGDTAFRVRLHSPGHPAEPADSLLVGLPLPASAAEDRGWWWYVGALRRITCLISKTRIPLAYGDDGVAVVDAAAVLEQESFPDEPEATVEDGVDYVIGDLRGDALWHEAPASAVPGLYRIVGFDLRTSDTLCVYPSHQNRVIGIDLAVRDSETGRPRTVGWWASAKLMALLRPEDPESLAVHKVPGTEGPRL